MIRAGVHFVYLELHFFLRINIYFLTIANLCSDVYIYLRTENGVAESQTCYSIPNP